MGRGLRTDSVLDDSDSGGGFKIGSLLSNTQLVVDRRPIYIHEPNFHSNLASSPYHPIRAPSTGNPPVPFTTAASCESEGPARRLNPGKLIYKEEGGRRAQPHKELCNEHEQGLTENTRRQTGL